MKKIFILSLFVCVLLCGCKPLSDMTIEEVISSGTERTIKVYNKYRKGYGGLYDNQHCLSFG